MKGDARNKMQEEIWKFVKGNKRYKVSTFGNVYDLEKQKMLKQYVKEGGYSFVYFSDSFLNKYDIKLVHRLVAEAFIMNPKGKKTVNHKDENKKNNNVYNLSWATHKEQVNYGTRTKRVRESMPTCRIVRNKNDNMIYDSIRGAERETGISKEHIIRACNNKNKNQALNDWEFV